MFTITFNRETSPYAWDTREANLLYLGTQENYLNTVLKIRGYVYLNQIYETIGVEWKPEWENLCLLYKDGVRIDFKIRKVTEDEVILDID